MPYTNYLNQKIIQFVFGGVTFSPPSTLYVGLSSAQPTLAQAGSVPWNFLEPSGAGYARVSVLASAFTGASTQSFNGYEVQNTGTIAFPVSTGPWLGGVSLAYAGFWDASSGGNLLAYGALSPSLTVPGAGYQQNIPIVTLVEGSS